MPEGVPAAALRPEPAASGARRMAVRRGVPAHLRHQPLRRRRPVLDRLPLRRPRRAGVPVTSPTGGAPPRGTYVYPDGPAAGNGADIFRVAVGLTETDTWWRVDWNTLLDASVPIALFTFDTDRGASTHRPMAGGRRRPLRRHRPRTARLGRGRPADRPHDRRVDTRRAHRRHGVAVLHRPGPALVGGTHRHLDGPAGGRAGQRRRATGSPRFPSSAARCPGSPTSTTSPSAATSRRRHT